MNNQATVALNRPAAIPASESPRQERLSQAIDEFYAAVDAGQSIDRERLFEKYVDIAEELEDCLYNLDFIHQITPQLRATAAAPDGNSALLSSRAHLGDYHIIRELGRGGMGVVYEAEQLSLGRRVALKVLPFAAMLDKQQLNRFKNEARAAGTLDHPNIVAIHSVGCERGVHYYAMQLIGGQSLAEIIAAMKPGRPPSDEEAAPAAASIKHPAVADTAKAALPTVQTSGNAVFSSIPPFDSREYVRGIARLGIQAAEALDHAHQNGILHRDVKPANLLVDDSGKLWVTDFGLARIEQDVGMTMTGDILGTLRYMSPEQALAKRVVVDHRSDIYSLGVTLYELLTLKPSFTGDDRQELLRQIAFDEPRKPRQINDRIPQDLETIILKSIEKNPAGRYATAQELADDLQRFVQDQPIKAKPQSRFATARKWSRRHRPVVWAAVATLLVSCLVLAGSIGWISRDSAARRTVAEATADLALDEATRLAEESKWSEALAEIRRAEYVLSNGGHAGAAMDRARELRKDIEMVLRLNEIGTDPGNNPKDEVTSYSTSGDVAFRNLDDGPKLAQAFRDYGIDVDAMDPGEAAARIRDRVVWLELSLALDYLAKWRKGGNDPSWQRVLAIARTTDPDPWRNRLRDVLQLPDSDRKAGIIALAGSVGSEGLPPRTALNLAAMLDNDRAFPEAIELLRATQQRHPDNYSVNFQLARILTHGSAPDLDGAIRFNTAAIALRPDSSMAHNNQGNLFLEISSHKEAMIHYQEAVRLEPASALAHSNLAISLALSGALDESMAHSREAIRLNPRYAQAHVNLAHVLFTRGMLDEALASDQEAVRLHPGLPEARQNVGELLLRKSQFDDGLASYRQAIRLYRERGRQPKAKAAYDEALELLEKHQSPIDVVARFRAEAAELLGITESQSPTNPQPLENEVPNTDNPTPASPPTTDNND